MTENAIEHLFPKETPEFADPHWSAEWLVTNGLGGYASGTVAGKNTRGFHGFLIAALPSPHGRTMMLNDVYEDVQLPDNSFLTLDSQARPGNEHSDRPGTVFHFRLEFGLPVWTYKTNGFTLERRLWLTHCQNTVFVNYRLVSGTGSLRLLLRPALHLRSHEAAVSTPLSSDYSLKITEDRYEISNNTELPLLRLQVSGDGGAFTIERRRLDRINYLTEASRGYAALGELWSPGCFSAELSSGKDVTLIASTETWEAMLTLTPAEAYEAECNRRRRMLAAADPRANGNLGKQLVLAADQFIISPEGRVEDSTRAKAAGDEIRTVIAGYHWFTDWGRDTMISLEGLTMSTGRTTEASYILYTFTHAIRDGLIPNLFPEGGREGLYHTADATLWFFHAIDRYIEVSGDEELLPAILPSLLDIMRHHIEGTRFNIHVDPADGLLAQGQDGYQLTWMDAKVEDWVVTPRRGKAVEINALWYNALRLIEAWCKETGLREEADAFKNHAEKAEQSFNRRFWYEEGGYLYDVVDGEGADVDPSCRPNQILAIALKYPVLDRTRWEPVVNTVKERLLTPVGLRSLAPGSKDYKSQYYGDLRSRDAAYHQGTVWAWLIGPFIDAWLKVHPGDKETARAFLNGFEEHLSQACIGSISEIFDAEYPYTPRGCIAQAWSVAEILRSFVKTA
jgi:predicted glycogen debranching enzyme